MKIWTGMSGWTYEPWRGTFYPKGLAVKKELQYASRQVTSIEINGTFYALQRAKSFKRWYEETPEDFVFSVKAPRYITHIRRAKDVETPVANFLASGLFCLKEKLGAILWQFPPNMMLKDDRFEKLIEMLPRTPAEAQKLAGKHSEWLEDKETSAKGCKEFLHAFEFRHPSFANADFLKMMAKKNIALVYAHGGEKSLALDESTADFVYARMHGEGKGFKKGYPKKEVDSLLEKLADWKPKKAFVYFDTEAKQYAPKDALSFIKRVSK